MEPSIEDIKKKISSNDAVVMTSQEICELVEKGEDITIRDVDVVTTATQIGRAHV